MEAENPGKIIGGFGHLTRATEGRDLPAESICFLVGEILTERGRRVIDELFWESFFNRLSVMRRMCHGRYVYPLTFCCSAASRSLPIALSSG